MARWRNPLSSPCFENIKVKVDMSKFGQFKRKIHYPDPPLTPRPLSAIALTRDDFQNPLVSVTSLKLSPVFNLITIEPCLGVGKAHFKSPEH